MIPAGWTISIVNGELFVVSPKEGPGGGVVENKGPLSQRMLYALAKDLLLGHAIAECRQAREYMRDDHQRLPPEVFERLPQEAQQALVTIRGLADAPMRIHPRDAKEAADYVIGRMLAPQVPDALPDFLRWCADELMKRDPTSLWAPSVAASMKGRAIILDRVAAVRAKGGAQ